MIPLATKIGMYGSLSINAAMGVIYFTNRVFDFIFMPVVISLSIFKVIIDENIHYMHMILNKGECLPEHFSNAKNVYITVIRGTLSATLNEQETHEYQAGTVLKVPFHTKMNLKNVSEETLEFIVVKAPAPNC